MMMDRMSSTTNLFFYFLWMSAQDRWVMANIGTRKAKPAVVDEQRP